MFLFHNVLVFVGWKLITLFVGVLQDHIATWWRATLAVILTVSVTTGPVFANQAGMDVTAH